MWVRFAFAEFCKSKRLSPEGKPAYNVGSATLGTERWIRLLLAPHTLPVFKLDLQTLILSDYSR